MSTLLHIFKAGTHVANDGRSFTFSEADLAATAAAYDPAKHEAPLVVGHPKLDAPAYGWVKSLQGGSDLQAVPDQVEPAFAELVNTGRFKKISAAFFPPTHPDNPVPGVYYLRHVGFLGANPPAVKGLRSPQFGEAAEGLIEFSLADDAGESLWNRVRSWLEQNVAPTHKPAAPAFSQGATMTPEQIAAREAELAAQAAAQARKDAEQAGREAQFAEREQRLAQEEAARRTAEIAAFAAQLVTEGKLLPAHRDGLVAFMASVDATQVIEFGEGEGKKSTPGLQWLKDYLVASPKLVEFGERAGNKGTVEGQETDAATLAKRAVEFQQSEAAAGRVITVTEAVTHVQRQGGK